MKLTHVLNKQHIGWHLKQIWKVQSKRPVAITKAEKVLKQRGVEVVDANDVITRKKVSERYVHLIPNRINKDYANRRIHYADNNKVVDVSQ